MRRIAKTPADRRAEAFVAVCLAVTLLVRLAAFLAVQATAPGRAFGPDSPSYLNPARALAADGRFLAAPGRTDLPETIRTPGYPAFLALFLALFGPSPAPAIAVQILLSALTPLLVYAIARDLWDARTAAAGVLLLCLDPISFLASQMALSDSLFATLLMAALLAGCRALRTPRFSPAWTLLFGSLLATATLVRPISYYLVAPALLILGLAIRSRGRRRAELVLGLSLAALPWLLLVGGWQLRNRIAAGSATFSHIAGVNLLEYRAAGVVAERDGVSLEKAREGLVRAAGARAEESIATRLDRQAREGSAIIRDHPLLALRVHLRGLARMLLVPGEGDVLQYLGVATPPTGVLGDLLRLPWRDFQRRWVATHPALLCVFALAAAYCLTIYAGTARAAMLLPAEDRRGRLACHALLAAAGFYLLLVSPGPEAYARFRLPLMPILALYAGRGLTVWRPRPGRYAGGPVN